MVRDTNTCPSLSKADERPSENGPTSYQVFKQKYTYPIPKPADKEKYPSNAKSTLVQAFSSEPAANRASPRASAVLPSSYFWFRQTPIPFLVQVNCIHLSA